MREMTAPPGTQTIVGQTMTLEEFSRLPKDGIKYELLGGKLSMTPAGLQHEEIGVKLLAVLIKYLEQQPLGHLYGSSAGFRLADDTILSPDLSFVRNEQLPTGRSPQGYGNFAPDLAIEIISPNDLMSELEAKVQLYLDNGTRLVWVINPQLRSATIYRADGTLRRVHDKVALDGEDVLPGFLCLLTNIL